MTKQVLIKNANIVNEGKIFNGDVLIEGDRIVEIAESISAKSPDVQIFDAEGTHLLPGVIDDQVHFREPGLTHKENIEMGSRAAVAGGITSFIEMPNTIPQTTTIEKLEEKFKLAEAKSYANYSFMFGGTNDNLEEILKVDSKTTAALKLFLGSSTGNMLVDDEKVLEQIFSKSPLLIAVHCEDEETIQKNLQEYTERYGDDIPIEERPDAEIAGFGDSGVDILIEFWMEGIDDGENRVGADLLLMIWDALKEHNIEIPYPQREVKILNADERRFKDSGKS